MIMNVALVVVSFWLATYSARHVKPIWVHQVLTTVCLVSILTNLVCIVLSLIEL